MTPGYDHGNIDPNYAGHVCGGCGDPIVFYRTEPTELPTRWYSAVVGGSWDRCAAAAAGFGHRP